MSTRPDHLDQPQTRDVPIYLKIEGAIRSAIATGALPAGERVPSEAELSSEFRTTRSTVRQALSRLVYEGLITRHVGRGSFVAEPDAVHSPIDSRRCLTFEEQVALTGRTVTYGSPSLELIAAPRGVAERLRLPASAQVFKLERLRLVDGKPVGLEIRYVSQEVGRRVTGDMLAHRSAHSFVGEILGERIPTIVVSVTAEIAVGRTARLLDVPEGAPLIVRDNAHHDARGVVVLCGRSIFRGDVRTDYVLGDEPPPPHPS